MTTALGSVQQRLRRRRLVAGVLLAAGVVLLVVCMTMIGFFEGYRYTGLWENLLRLLAQCWPPNFDRLDLWWRSVFDTLAMALVGTVMAVVLAFPAGLAIARNTALPGPLAMALRWFLHGLRTIPDLIWAILLCVVVGTGPAAGACTLALHSLGVLGKIFAEHIEHARPGPIDAVRSSGAGEWQVISHGVVPQVLPLMADAGLYRLEVNIRMAAVLGFVGAGGMGAEIMNAKAVLAYDEVAALLVVLLVLVGAVDMLSSWVRRQLVV